MSKIKRFFITFIGLMFFWLILSFNFQPVSLLSGTIFSFLISLISYDIFIKSNEGLNGKMFRVLWFSFIYLFVLLYEMFLASFDVVYRVITMNINPEVVMIESKIKSDLGKVFLANSITLTPGTITIDIEGQFLYVHWLYARTTNFENAAELIKGRFEDWLRRIFI